MAEIQLNIPGLPIPPRPSKPTLEMVLEAAKKAGAKLKLNEREINDLARVYSHPTDGFKLGVELVSDHGWDLNRNDIDYLDSIENDVEDAIDVAVKAWVAEFNVKPEHPIGTMIIIRHVGLGEIMGYRDQTAEYEVRPQGQIDEEAGFRRHIIAYERAVLPPVQEPDNEAL